SNISPSSRSVSTLVLPVPAEAETQAETPGAAARRCAACASTVISPLLFIVCGDALEVPVVGEAGPPLRCGLREIGGRGVVEMFGRAPPGGRPRGRPL